VSLVRALVRPNRVELAAAAVMAGIMLVTVGGAVGWLVSFGIPAFCFDAAQFTAACEPFLDPISRYQEVAIRILPVATGTTLVIPILSAIALGIAMVARELEQQTTVLAWSLSPSRLRWLALRGAPIVLALLVLSLVAGLLGDVVAGLRNPLVDPYQSLDGLGARGFSIVGATLLVFGIALVVGAVLGRQLTALLLSGAILVAATQLVSAVTDGWLRGDAVIGAASEVRGGDRELDAILRTPEGEYIGWEEAYARYGPELEAIVYAEGSGFSDAVRYVPGELYPIATARLLVVLGGIACVAIALAFIVVHRRRPY
jgi:hypothetical protein